MRLPKLAAKRKDWPSRRMSQACRTHSRVADLDEGVEGGLEIERRAAYDLEDLGGRGLLLPGLAEIFCSRSAPPGTAARSRSRLRPDLRTSHELDLSLRERRAVLRPRLRTPTAFLA